jgi:hypothetical protein|tara:strand:+ start:638 stop:847 length:210 start_codon:yes stop_codon:yes gene_type:complete
MTKVWRKTEWEEAEKELEADPDFHWFIQDMYTENTLERQQDGRTPFLNIFEYYRTYPGWLKEVYKKKHG